MGERHIPEWGQGVLNDGAVILCDGIMVSIDDVVATLNQQAREIEALRKQLHFFRQFAQTVYVRHGEYVMRQYRLIDENGKPTKLLTGGRE